MERITPLPVRITVFVHSDQCFTRRDQLVAPSDPFFSARDHKVSGSDQTFTRSDHKVTGANQGERASNMNLPPILPISEHYYQQLIPNEYIPSPFPVKDYQVKKPLRRKYGSVF